MKGLMLLPEKGQVEQGRSYSWQNGYYKRNKHILSTGFVSGLVIRHLPSAYNLCSTIHLPWHDAGI